MNVLVAIVTMITSFVVSALLAAGGFALLFAAAIWMFASEKPRPIPPIRYHIPPIGR